MEEVQTSLKQHSWSSSSSLFPSSLPPFHASIAPSISSWQSLSVYFPSLSSPGKHVYLVTDLWWWWPSRVLELPFSGSARLTRWEGKREVEMKLNRTKSPFPFSAETRAKVVLFILLLLTNSPLLPLLRHSSGFLVPILILKETFNTILIRILYSSIVIGIWLGYRIKGRKRDRNERWKRTKWIFKPCLGLIRVLMFLLSTFWQLIQLVTFSPFHYQLHNPLPDWACLFRLLLFAQQEEGNVVVWCPAPASVQLRVDGREGRREGSCWLPFDWFFNFHRPVDVISVDNPDGQKERGIPKFMQIPLSCSSPSVSQCLYESSFLQSLH